MQLREVHLQQEVAEVNQPLGSSKSLRQASRYSLLQLMHLLISQDSSLRVIGAALLACFSCYRGLQHFFWHLCFSLLQRVGTVTGCSMQLICSSQFRLQQVHV